MQPQVRALAPDQLSLDDRQRQPAVLQARRERFSGDATTETDDVKRLGHVLTPSHLDGSTATKEELDAVSLCRGSVENDPIAE